MTWQERIEQIGSGFYEIKSDVCNESNTIPVVPVRIIATAKIIEQLKFDRAIEQAQAVAKLPGIVTASFVMPDAHQGYGFCIGGVAGFDATDDKAIISPGGIGFDINCGIRLEATNLTIDDKTVLLEIAHEVSRQIPLGQGGTKKNSLTMAQLNQVLMQGLGYAKTQNLATDIDLARCEDNGCLPVQDVRNVPDTAKGRGLHQLGTLGSGNHFIEFQIVEEICDPVVATQWGFSKVGQIVYMIHSGSRAVGHQTCSHYVREMEKADPALAESLVDKDLLYAPIASKIGQKYFDAMNASANFAFLNRFMMAHCIRSIVQEKTQTLCTPIYDIAHNICKKEMHFIHGKPLELYVHRKGATRAIWPHHPLLNKTHLFFETGYPVLLPGSMGTSSYVLQAKNGAEQTLASFAHGSGRVLGRKRAQELLSQLDPVSHMESQGVHLITPDSQQVLDELPQVYKDSHEVVQAGIEAGIVRPIVKLKPFIVIKG